MSDLKVDKNEVPALLCLADGTTIDGWLFLSPFSPGHLGPQTVEDLMDEADQVLPCRTSGGKFLLVGKRNIAAVAVPASSGRPPGFWAVTQVAVRLSGPHVLAGELLIEEGGGRRLSDALNGPHTWIPLETEEHLVWLAKDHLVTLEGREG